MIRVGFINIFAVNSWLGGLNYLRNLLHAVCALESRRIQPVFITGQRTSEKIASEFSFMPLARTSALDRGRPLWMLRKLSTKFVGGDTILGRVLRDLDVDILSHSGDLGRGARMPSIAWIPDLQHRHLSHLFSDEEIATREHNIARALEANVRVIVSSETAAAHLRAGSRRNSDKIRVLRFVSGLMHGCAMPKEDDLRACYQINGRYMLLPNQFWAHKNHRVVVEALAQLKRDAQPVTVVATGLMRDPRQPSHVAQLMETVARFGLEELFRPLGVVPYADMLGLMRDAVAVINPSLFEGWSTSVEEAKSMGKTIVLSNIPVHIEQAPDRGIYFDPQNVDDAAHAISKAWANYDPGADEAAMSKASLELPGRIRLFAENYQSLVIEALEASGQ